MKKVLMGLLGVIIIAGAVVVMFIYQKQQASALVGELSKFTVADDESFEAFLAPERLKWRKFDAKNKKENVPEPAPLYALKVKGEDIVETMSTTLKDTSQPMNVRYAAAIVLAHTKKKEGIDPLIEALKEKEERLGECVSFLLNLLGHKEVPEKIAEVLKSESDPKVKKNAYRAITFWVTDEKGRMENEVPMEAVVKGLEEKDKDTLLLIFKYMKRMQFRFLAGKGDKETPGQKLSKNLLPMIAHEDPEISEAAADALAFQLPYMDDPTKGEMIVKVAEYLDSARPKMVRLNAVKVISRLNRELAQNSATIGNCNLDPLVGILESDDPDLLNPVLDCFSVCGTKREHRVAVQKFFERIADEDLKKKAEEAKNKIADREEEQ